MQLNFNVTALCTKNTSDDHRTFPSTPKSKMSNGSTKFRSSIRGHHLMLSWIKPSNKAANSMQWKSLFCSAYEANCKQFYTIHVSLQAYCSTRNSFNVFYLSSGTLTSTERSLKEYTTESIDTGKYTDRTSNLPKRDRSSVPRVSSLTCFKVCVRFLYRFWVH